MASDKQQEVMDTLARPAVSKSDRSRAGWGSLLMSVQTAPDLCTRGRKCVLKNGHKIDCWPHD